MPPDHPPVPGLTFGKLSEQNRSRKERWHAGGEEWMGSDWSNAMCGEAGEAANVVKKLRRHETHVDRIAGGEGSYNTPPLDELGPHLAEELADVILYADLLADHYGLDLEPAIVEKFNRVSEAQGFPERLASQPLPDRSQLELAIEEWARDAGVKLARAETMGLAHKLAALWPPEQTEEP